MSISLRLSPRRGGPAAASRLSGLVALALTATLGAGCGPAAVIRERADGGGAGDGAVPPLDAAARPDGAPGGDGAPPGDAGMEADGAPPLGCDPGFSLTPASPETGALLEVTYSTTAAPYAYVGLALQGPGLAERTDVTLVSGQSPWAWRWTVALHAGGLWRLAFTAGEPSAEIAACEVPVLDTGPPPELPVLPGDCSQRVCGDDDGAGGTCSRCPMVAAEGGACFDPPSPIGPSGPGPWACLDNAGCETWGPVCRIWCPGEPCDPVRHPEGCPQGVETCYVDPHLTDYEEACRQCCESRYHAPTGEYACWDGAYNLCRYPGDCGQPYPLP